VTFGFAGTWTVIYQSTRRALTRPRDFAQHPGDYRQRGANE